MVDTSLVFNILARDKTKGGWDNVKASAAAAGVAVGAVLAATVVTGFEQEKAQDRLAAQIGAAPWADKAGKAASDLYKNAWGESMSQVGDAVRAVMQGGLLGGDATEAEIEGITAKALDLSTAFDQDVAGTARAAAQMVRTGLAGSAEEAMDILTRGFQATGDLAGDLLDTYSEYGTQFRKLGLDGATATGLLAQGLQAGARDVDTVADSIKEFSIRAIDGSATSAAGFEALGLNAEKMSAQIAAGGEGASAGLGTVLERLRGIEDPVKRDAAAVALFGTKAEDMGAALLALDPSSATSALGQVEGAAGELSDTLNDNAATQLEAFKRQVQGALVDQMAKAIPHLQGVGRFLGEHKAIVVPLVAALGTFAAIVGTIVAISKVWTAVQIALNIAMSLNPVGAIIMAIVALIAIIVLLVKNWDTVKKVAAAVWGWIWGKLKAFGKWFMDVFWRGSLKKVIDLAKAGFNVFANWIRSRVDIIVGLAGRLMAFGARIRQIFSDTVAKVRERITAIVDFVRGLPGRILRAVGNLGSLLLQAGRNVIEGLISGIREKIGAIGAAMSDAAQTVRDYWPFSPARRGPLSGSGDPTRAGQNISQMMAAGIRTQVPAIASSMFAVTSVVQGGMGRAASEILAHLRGGGNMFEDFTFRGASGNVGRFNDQLADQFFATGRNFDRRNVTGFLRGVAAPPPVTLRFDFGNSSGAFGRLLKEEMLRALRTDRGFRAQVAARVA